MPESSLLVRLRWVSLAMLALSVMLTVHRQNVADLVRALILEEGARAVAPQRVRVGGGRLRLRHRHLTPACSRAASSDCRSPYSFGFSPIAARRSIDEQPLAAGAERQQGCPATGTMRLNTAETST